MPLIAVCQEGSRVRSDTSAFVPLAHLLGGREPALMRLWREMMSLRDELQATGYAVAAKRGNVCLL